MKVCIAEKPSVGKEIARILGATKSHSGYMEGNGYQVTWTFGHLCGLKEPHEYDDKWRSWTLASLPILPEKFGIKIIDNDGIKRQFAVIERLVAHAECVINCGDAGQEGELIQRWVMQKAGVKCPILRLWISSMTDESISEGFKNLQPAQKYDPLYEAGLSRAIGDWLLGMNATRLFTIKYRKEKQVLSVGRVQTPTLAMIVNRQREIQNFTPTQYWELKTSYRDTLFSATKGRFDDQSQGEAFLEQVKRNPLVINKISKKKGIEAPPRLFDLTSLQVECNKKLNLSADDTLKIIQSLYEKKLMTYPRVDTTFLPDDVYPKIAAALRCLRDFTEYTEPILAGKIPKSKKIFDNSKVTDHHAIIPTGVVANNLNEVERKVYSLIAQRFVAAFSPDCQFSTTTVEAQAGDIPFKVTGKLILVAGWRALYAKEKKEDSTQEDSESLLPNFEQGESGAHEPCLSEKWTQPPKAYTEATLLRAMETAGKQIEDEELRDLLKENGIGRPSTRAAIIETLFKRQYIKKERKSLIATEMGVTLIDLIDEELLKSAELTGQWERKLRMIEKGAYETRVFQSELKQMVSSVVEHVKSGKPQSTQVDHAITCPICRNSKVLKGKAAYGCRACTLRIPFVFEGRSLSESEVLELVQKGKTALLDGFTGEHSSGYLRLNTRGEVEFEAS